MPSLQLAKRQKSLILYCNLTDTCPKATEWTAISQENPLNKTYQLLIKSQFYSIVFRSRHVTAFTRGI